MQSRQNYAPTLYAFRTIEKILPTSQPTSSIKPTNLQHQSWLQATSLSDTENCGSTKDKDCQNILKPHNHNMNVYIAYALSALDGENVLKLN